MVRALDLRAKDREFDPPVLLSGYDIGQVVHTHVPLSSSGKKCKRPKGGDALRLGR